MDQMSLATSERTQLANLLLEKGPNFPTLCGDWNTQELAAHLLIRESRPWIAAGMFLPGGHRIVADAMGKITQQPFEHVVAQWMKGPKWGYLGRYLDSVANRIEHFVHHEDVRRGETTVGQWQNLDLLPSNAKPRVLSGRHSGELYDAMRWVAPLLLRRSACPVVIEPIEFPRLVVTDTRVVSSRGDCVVHVRGDIGEVVLWILGRNRVDLFVDGPTHLLKKSRI